MGTPDTQVWGGWHARLGIPVWEASDGAVLQGAAYSCLSTASCTGETLVAAASRGKPCWSHNVAPFPSGRG